MIEYFVELSHVDLMDISMGRLYPVDPSDYIRDNNSELRDMLFLEDETGYRVDL